MLTPGAEAVDGRDGRARLDRARLAQGIWRRRAVPGRNQGAARGDGRDPRAQSAQQLRHLDARAGAAEIRHRRAEARASAQDRARRNPLVPGLFGTQRRLRPRRPADLAPRTRATIISSTARRCGPATPTRPTGSSASSAPTRRASRAGSASCCSTWRAPGVSTKPILLISGYSPFCETFFDNVRVPKANLVHEENKGWDVAKYLLGHEREMICGMGLGGGGRQPAGRRRDRDDRARSRRPARRPAAARADRAVRGPRQGVPRDVGAVHRRTQGRQGAPRAADR